MSSPSNIRRRVDMRIQMQFGRGKTRLWLRCCWQCITSLPHKTDKLFSDACCFKHPFYSLQTKMMLCAFSSDYNSSATVTETWSWTYMCKNVVYNEFTSCFYKICYIKVAVLMTFLFFIALFHSWVSEATAWSLDFWGLWWSSLGIRKLTSCVSSLRERLYLLNLSVLSKQGEFAGSGTDGSCEFITLLRYTVETLLKCWFYEYNKIVSENQTLKLCN